MSGLKTRTALWRENGKRPHTLYRLFDGEENLLYVGITFMPHNRFYQHSKEKSWWNQVERRETVEFPNRKEALDAEQVAIETERPVHNYEWNQR